MIYSYLGNLLDAAMFTDSEWLSGNQSLWCQRNHGLYYMNFKSPEPTGQGGIVVIFLFEVERQSLLLLHFLNDFISKFEFMNHLNNYFSISCHSHTIPRINMS